MKVSLQIIKVLLLASVFLMPSTGIASTCIDRSAGCDICCSDDSVAHIRAFDYYFLQALSLKEQERYDEAFELFEHCLAIQPQSSSVFYELYAMYLYLGRREEAIAMIKRAAENDPQNFWYRDVLAAAYEEAGNREAAIEVYKAMARDFPGRSDVYPVMAGLYADISEYDKALDALNTFERIEGKSEQITLYKFRLYMIQKKKDEAIAELLALISEYPDDKSTKVFLGDTYMQLGDKEEALKIYCSILDEDADNVSARVSLAEYYRAEGNDSLFTGNMEKLFANNKFVGDERTEMLTKYIAYKEKTDTTGYNARFLAKLMQQEHERAKTAEIYARYQIVKKSPEDSVAPLLKIILKEEPENSFAHLLLLEYAIKRQDLDEIISRSDTAILYNPDILELYYYKGVAHYQQKDYVKSINAFRKGLDVVNDEYGSELISDFYSLLGDIYHETGRMDSCFVCYDSALMYNSENLSVLNNYAYFLSLDNRNLDKAEEMSYRTIKAEPENTVYIDTYMWVLFCRGRYDEAKAYAEKLISILGDDADTVLLHHCGDIFAKCGETERAVEYWQRALLKGGENKLLKKKIKKRKYIPDDKKK